MLDTYLEVIVGDLLLVDVSDLKSDVGRSQHLGPGDSRVVAVDVELSLSLGGVECCLLAGVGSLCEASSFSPPVSTSGVSVVGVSSRL